MIRMVQSTSADHAKSYFSDALLKADYFINDQELPGYFHGKLAERISLNSRAGKEQFFALCENINPKTGKRLTARTRDDRTIGYDINFHCPKSVSILNALNDDGHIIKAFNKSVYDTMKNIEADSQARVRKNGKQSNHLTGELIWAEFTHQTARPVDNSVADPHLHSHNYVWNATWSEECIKAGQFIDIKRDMPYYQAMFHKRLADNLEDAGYTIRRTAKSFEVEGVPRSVIQMFSKRTNEIGEFAKEHGITDAEELSELGARTRAKKQKGLSMPELRQNWRKQINALADKSGNLDMPVRYGPKKTNYLKDEDCIDFALNHCFERASVMPRRRLLENVYRESIGHRKISLKSLTDKFNFDTRIIKVAENGLIKCTTLAVLKEEQLMVGLAKKGQNKFQPLYKQAPQTEATGQTGQAIRHVLTSKDQVSIIRGAAGAGKTTLLKELNLLMKVKGKDVTVVAPTARASRGVLAKEGFTDAQTVSKVLMDEQMQQKLKGQVLICDEAGMLGTKDMISLLKLAERNSARLILVGDTRQHASVVRGDALRIINTVGGIHVAEVSMVRRQQVKEYREAVQNLSEGNIAKGFERLDLMGAIEEIDPLKPNKMLVEAYTGAIKDGKSALIVSPTHKQGERVTDDIRNELKNLGMIGKKEVAFTSLVNLNFTEAQKSDWRNFETGQIIHFDQNVPKISRGSSWEISQILDQEVSLVNGVLDKQVLPLSKAKSYSVYQKKTIKLAKGDLIKITKNGFDNNEKRFDNGQSLIVSKVYKNGDVHFKNTAGNGRFQISKDFGHIAHDYCSTSHSSQGRTVDNVFVSQPADTFSATDAKQFYVSVSRGKFAAKIYTDDKAKLLQHALRLGNRQSAIELVQNHKDAVITQQRLVNPLRTDFPKPLNNHLQQQKKDYEPGI